MLERAPAGRFDPPRRSRHVRFAPIASKLRQRSETTRYATSRQGRSDYGVNAARIRAYMSALRKRIG
jgi:hypothetical protein